VRPLIQVAARGRWAEAAGGGSGVRLDRVDAPWGWSSVGRRRLIRAYEIKGGISDALASLLAMGNWTVSM
jgi:hypothetical protein